MPTADISAALGRSISEIFRMLQVLEEHGYISRSGEGYRVTNRLFALGMAQPPIRDLLSHALPRMHALAHHVRQSCHLAMASGSEMVVVANVETPGLLGFAVRMGYRRPLIHSASGHILLAFQAGPARSDLLRDTETAGLPFDREALDAVLARVRTAGFITMASPMLMGITDVSAPVLRDGAAVAALTMPFVAGPGLAVDMAEASQALRAAAAGISAALPATS
ncbi:IclR family transcriptional regulator [Sphingomonas nostoxanthinifaciens]|uniref:IclR family transcriptional regulator n=1 Tax=Sphingomonas nostoxanthinifaciens TaxID=2872652 RepID=UPI0021DA6076|nr:IclR family transcriptional regulator C-terminal domain-containing protein [Sphingomonas nostoxanthinifaciens]